MREPTPTGPLPGKDTQERRRNPQETGLQALRDRIGALSSAELGNILRADQVERWQHGERVLVEAYLAKWPELPMHTEVLLELIYSEVVLREQLGEQPQESEYLERFPQYTAQLQRQFALHRALESGSLMDCDLGPEEPQTRLSVAPETGGTLVGSRPTATNESRTDPQQPTVANLTAGLPSLPGYEILATLGQGGMGIVYKAWQVTLKRPVAIKMILPRAHANTAARNRFYREAEAVARLHHPNIVQIYEIREHDGVPYCALEFVEGVSLAQHLAATPQPGRVAAELLEVLARAVHYAHTQGIVHRDLKPANILLQKSDERPAKGEAADRPPSTPPPQPNNEKTLVPTERRTGQVSPSPHWMESSLPNTAPNSSPRMSRFSPRATTTAFGVPKITDFGLAKLLDQDTSQTRSGEIMGTPSYMAPEQAAGKNREIGPAADIYALGAILYEMLTGRPPFRADTLYNTMLQVIGEDPVPPTRLQSLSPRPLETICLKCLNKDASQRYAAAEDLADDLRRFLNGEPIHAVPAGLWERTVKWARRRPAVASLAASLIVVILVSFALVSWQWWRAEEKARDEARARRDTEVARENESLERYYQSLAAAEAKWNLNDLRGAEAALEKAPPALRRWEWHYLDRLLHADLFTVPGQHAVAYSRDGRILATADGTEVGLYDAATGQKLRGLPGHESRVTRLAFSPRGDRLASGSDDETVRIWDPADGKELLRFPGHSDAITTLAFSPDGSRIASGANRVVEIWDAATGKNLHTLVGHQALVAAAAFSPDGKYLATAGADKTIRLWEPTTGKPIRELPGHGDTVTSLVFSPDSQRLISGSKDRTVRLWDPATGALEGVRSGHTSCVNSVAVSQHGRHLASVSGDFQKPGEIIVWDLAEAQPQQVYHGHGGAIDGVAFRPDGRQLASVGDGHVKVWDATTGPEARTLRGHPSEVGSVVFSPDGRHLASGDAAGNVMLWDAAAKQAPRTLSAHEGMVYGVALSPDGRLLASAGNDGLVKVWDVRTLQLLASCRGHKGAVWSVAFSPQGEQLASGGEDQTIRTWNARTGAEVRTSKGHTDRVSAVAFSPDGATLASASRDGTVRLWDAASGEQRHLLEGHHYPVSWVAFSPDGKLLASGGGGNRQGEIQVWNSATGEPLAQLNGRSGRVLSVAFGDDGRRLASSGWEDGTVQVWDPLAGRETITLSGHKGPVIGVAFSPDGRRLASAGADRTVRVWDATPRARRQ